MGLWLTSDRARRVGRTLVQVFGGVIVAFLLDYGADGSVVLRDYVFGQSGVIITATAALAVWMNRQVDIDPAERIDPYTESFD